MIVERNLIERVLEASIVITAGRGEEHKVGIRKMDPRIKALHDLYEIRDKKKVKKIRCEACGGKIVEHGAKGYIIGQVGSSKWKSYCARSAGISKKFNLDCSGRDKCSPNCLSRKKWSC